MAGRSSARLRIPACLTVSSPYAYLHDVLTRMVDGHPVSRLDELLPSTWKARDSAKS